MKHKRAGVPPVAIARQLARYEKAKAERTKVERSLLRTATDDDLLPWLRAISAQVIARRKLVRMGWVPEWAR